MKLEWNLADFFMALMVILNLIAIEPLQDYLSQKKERKDPVFIKENIKSSYKNSIEFWD